MDPRLPQMPPTGNDINHDHQHSAPSSKHQNPSMSLPGYTGSLPPPMPPLDSSPTANRQQELETAGVDLRPGANAGNQANSNPNWLNFTAQQKQHHAPWSPSSPINHHQQQQQQQRPNDSNNQQQQPSTTGQHHQVPPPTTMLTSYVNTLKNSISTTKVPSVVSTTYTTPTENVGSEMHQPSAVIKADFDVVSPAQHFTTTTPTTTTTHSNASPSNDFRAQPSPNLVKTWPQDTSSVFVQNKTSGERPFAPEDHSDPTPLKPGLDAANIDPTKQLGQPATKSSGQPTTVATNEIDGNQIDSKSISKDYRSSGDQSVGFDNPNADPHGSPSNLGSEIIGQSHRDSSDLRNPNSAGLPLRPASLGLSLTGLIFVCITLSLASHSTYESRLVRFR